MARVRLVVGVLLALSGAVWMLQGLNARYAPASFMTGSRPWVAIGAVGVVGGVVLARSGARRRGGS